MNQHHQPTLTQRFKRTLRMWRRNYRVCRRYARRWDAACSSLRLTWAHIDL